jgi:hypothetical protein
MQMSGLVTLVFNPSLETKRKANPRSEKIQTIMTNSKVPEQPVRAWNVQRHTYVQRLCKGHCAPGAMVALTGLLAT